MSGPEADWVGRVVPAAPDWRLGLAWRGEFTGGLYRDVFACFAANRTCSQEFVREPITRVVLPFAIPYIQSLDLPDVPGGGGEDANEQPEGEA